MNEEQKNTYDQFNDLVNMTAKQLTDWLKTEQSKNTGQDSGDGEAIGHKSGKMIVEILNKNQSELKDDDFDQMKRVISYISRHTAQKPDGDVSETNWNYSLKNWGYDYSKDKN